MRPAWWVLRGYLLVQAADVLTGNWESLDLLPQLGVWMLGPLLTLVAGLLSVEVGRGRLWPGIGRPVRVHARAALLALNVGALVAVVPVVDAADRLGPELIAVRDAAGYVDQSGLRLRGDRICNIQPYDADGPPAGGRAALRPGRRADHDQLLEVGRGERGPQHYPWASLGEDRWNVFPQPERTGDRRVKDDAWTSGEPPTLPEPEVLRVPAGGAAGSRGRRARGDAAEAGRSEGRQRARRRATRRRPSRRAEGTISPVRVSGAGMRGSGSR